MNHSEYTLWMSLALDGMLTPTQERRLQSHLAECARCRALWERFALLDDRLRAEPAVMPAPGFTARVEARLRAQRRRRYGVLGGVLMLLSALSLWSLSAMALLGLAGWWLAHRPHVLIRLIEFLTTSAALLAAMNRVFQMMWASLTAPPMQPVLLGYAVFMLILSLLWWRLAGRERERPSGEVSI